MADEAANPRVVRQRLRGVIKDALQKHLEVLQAAEALAKRDPEFWEKFQGKEAGKESGTCRAMKKDSLDTTASMPSSDLAMGEGVTDWKRAGVSGRLLEKVRASARHTGTAHTIGVEDPVRVAPSGALSLPGRSSAPMPLPKTEIAKAGIHDAKTVVSGKPRPTSAMANDWKPGTAVGSTSGSVSFPKRAGLAAANLNAAPTRSWEKGELAKAQGDPMPLGLSFGCPGCKKHSGIVFSDHPEPGKHNFECKNCGATGVSESDPRSRPPTRTLDEYRQQELAHEQGKRARGEKHSLLPRISDPKVKKTDIAAVAHGVGTVVPAVRAAATGMVAALRARAKLGGIGKAEIKTGTVDSAPAKGAVLPGDKKPEIVGGKADDAGSGGDVEKGKSPLKKAERQYHVVAIHEKTGKKERLSSSPMSHHEAVTMKDKFSSHPARRVQLEEHTDKSLKKDAADVAFGIPGSMKPKMPRTTPGLPGMTSARPAPAAKPMGRPEGLHAPASADTLAADKKAAGVGLMASLITRFKGIGKRGWSAPSAHSSQAGAVRAMGRRMAMAEKPSVADVMEPPHSGPAPKKVCLDCGSKGSHLPACGSKMAKAGTLPAGPAAAPKTVASIPKTPAAGPKGPRMKTTGGAGPA